MSSVKYPYPAPVFTRHDDGTVTVDKFQPVVWFSTTLLHYADSSMFDIDGDVVTIRVANGTAKYRLDPVDPAEPNAIERRGVLQE